MRAVNTSVLVRLIARDDPKQVASAEEFVQAGAWVSHLVLAETTWVLASAYNRTAAQIALALEMFIHHEHLRIQDADVVEAALEQFRKRPALGFSDCLIVEVARQAGHLPVGTFDRDLARAEGVEKL